VFNWGRENWCPVDLSEYIRGIRKTKARKKRVGRQRRLSWIWWWWWWWWFYLFKEYAICSVNELRDEKAERQRPSRFLPSWKKHLDADWRTVHSVHNSVTAHSSSCRVISAITPRMSSAWVRYNTMLLTSLTSWRRRLSCYSNTSSRYATAGRATCTNPLRSAHYYVLTESQLTFILIIISSSSIPWPSFIPCLKSSFSANPFHCSLPFRLQDWLHRFSGLFTDTSEHIRFFYFFSSSVFTLFTCRFRAVD